MSVAFFGKDLWQKNKMKYLFEVALNVLSLDFAQRRKGAKGINLRRVHCHRELV